jgi:hypothetical protein
MVAAAAQALKLSHGQREQLLQLRQEHLARLRAIYQQRQDLNLQVGMSKEGVCGRVSGALEGGMGGARTDGVWLSAGCFPL